jgi:hypothetical protein
MRRSISRMSSAYSSNRAKSLAPKPRFRRAMSPITESKMLRSSRLRAARSSGVLPSPNSRSNTTCGLRSIGSGEVGEDQEIELVYAQL